jgi:hypothetical protein
VSEDVGRMSAVFLVFGKSPVTHETFSQIVRDRLAAMKES